MIAYFHDSPNLDCHFFSLELTRQYLASEVTFFYNGYPYDLPMHLLHRYAGATFDYQIIRKEGISQMDQLQHEQFKNHPFIQSISNIEKWTITDKDKMPIDMFELRTYGNIKGANFYAYQSLTKRPIVEAVFKASNCLPPNYAFYLESSIDDFVILDIEPICPEPLKQKLLQLPFIYGEKSLSGKGYHLVFPLPKNYMDFPITHEKPALKENNKYYEILLNHFCTFTGNIISCPTTPQGTIEDIFAQLATKAKLIVKQREVEIQTLTNKPDTEQADYVLQLLSKVGHNYKKKPEDYLDDDTGEPDLSRYEYSFICYLYHRLDEILSVSAIKKEHTYTDEEQAYFLYTVASEVLPFRKKHTETRTLDNVKLPWLGFVVKSVMQKTNLNA